MIQIKDIRRDDPNADYFEYLVRRWQKITTALYAVTGHIKDNDQIKWNVRAHAADLVSFIYEVIDAHDGQRYAHIDVLLKGLHTLSTEFLVMMQAGLIQKTNYHIIADEMENFSRELKEFKEKDMVVSPFQNEFMAIPKPALMTVVAHSPAKEKMEQHAVVLKDKIKKEKNSKEGSKGQNIKSTRRDTIIGLLSKGESLGIKDFVKAIKGCSEKTIQRELITLVAEGVLYKTGDRRWSVYSLVKQVL